MQQKYSTMKKEMMPLTQEENESYKKQKFCSICKK